MRKRRRIRRRRIRFFMVLCCIVCFLCGFTFRGSIRTAYADSDSSESEVSSHELQAADIESESDYGNNVSTEHDEEQKASKKYYKSIVVESGDSLYSIANKYYSADYDSIEKFIYEIKKVNGLRSDYICQGRYLTIPYYGEM